MSVYCRIASPNVRYTHTYPLQIRFFRFPLTCSHILLFCQLAIISYLPNQFSLEMSALMELVARIFATATTDSLVILLAVLLLLSIAWFLRFPRPSSVSHEDFFSYILCIIGLLFVLQCFLLHLCRLYYFLFLSACSSIFHQITDFLTHPSRSSYLGFIFRLCFYPGTWLQLYCCSPRTWMFSPTRWLRVLWQHNFSVIRFTPQNWSGNNFKQQFLVCPPLY